ncbi:MAG: C-GCAxxG-C-C family protein [Acutalibacteraceae bacterium]|nr:C-GCAxxG-C-C family protein [Acutalibacteraceae bacterium]
MSSRVEKAVELFKSGFNCSQAVFAAFAPEFGMDEETALKASAGLGGGVGRSREVCGAVCGAAMVVGLKYGATKGEDAESKAKCYEVVQEIIAEFRKTNPTIICRELLALNEGTFTDPKPEARTEQYYKKRPCVQLVEDAASAVEKILF